METTDRSRLAIMTAALVAAVVVIAGLLMMLSGDDPADSPSADGDAPSDRTADEAEGSGAGDGADRNPLQDADAASGADGEEAAAPEAPDLDEPEFALQDAPSGDEDPRWTAEPDAVVGSWNELSEAAESGASLLHLRGGEYGGVTLAQPDLFVRNVPGEAVTVTGTVVFTAPDMTLAGVEMAGRFEGRESGDGATLYRSMLTGSGVTFNGGGDELLGVLREVHRPERSMRDTGNVVTVNEDASLLLEDSWLEGESRRQGADGHLDTIQLINGGRDLTVRRSYVGSSHNSALHLITTGRIHIEHSFIDGPEAEQAGIGWEMRSTDVTLRNSIAFRPYWRLDWDPDFARSMDVSGSLFYDIPEQGRDGNLLFENQTIANEHFPDNIYGGTKPPAPTWHPPEWIDELG